MTASVVEAAMVCAAWLTDGEGSSVFQAATSLDTARASARPHFRREGDQPAASCRACFELALGGVAIGY